MELLNIEETTRTPKIVFNKNDGIFQIVGRSIPENPEEFYKPVVAWFGRYLESPNESTLLQIELDYFNSATSKVLLAFIQIFEPDVKNGLDFKIQWIYEEEDEDSLEAGQMYESILNVPFVFKAR